MAPVDPVMALADLDVAVGGPAGGPPVVELVDRRRWVELATLDPADAVALADRLRDAAVAAVTRAAVGSEPGS